jgi:hypothetical protein
MPSLASKYTGNLGTWQLSRKGFPSEIKDFSKRKAPSTEIFREVDGPLRIISYVSKGRKKKSDPTKFNVTIIHIYQSLI